MKPIASAAPIRRRAICPQYGIAHPAPSKVSSQRHTGCLRAEFQKCVKARALYDNIAEAPDELAFRKGDVLTVLEQNTAGLEGWWLCALRGRQGICPGNRLRLLVGQYDTGGCLVGSRADLTIAEDGIQRHGKRRSWHVQPNRRAKKKEKNNNKSVARLSVTQELHGFYYCKAPADEPPRLHWGMFHHPLFSHIYVASTSMLSRFISGITFSRRSGSTLEMCKLAPLMNETRRKIVVTPQKCGDVYLYDLPASRGSPAPPSRHESPLNSTNNEHSHNTGRYTSNNVRSSIDNGGGDVNECYDVPPRAIPVIPSPASSPSPAPSCYDIPRPPTSCTPNSNCSGGSGITPLDCYDVPRPLQPLTPSSSASSLTNDGSLSGSNRSSLAAPDYDVPRPRLPASSLPSRHNTPIPKTPTPPPPSQQIYDVPVSKELPLELDSALEGLQRLQSEASAAIARLLGFVSPGWRTPQRLDATLMDLRLAALRLRTSLHDLAEFAEGTLGNAGKAPDKGLATKLRPLVKALRDSDKLVQEAATELDTMEWDASKLCRGGGDTPTPTNGPPSSLLLPVQSDPLDQLIACARALTEDVRQVASFIQLMTFEQSAFVADKEALSVQGNSTLLFKRASIISTGSSNNSGAGEDYDYVNLDSREVVAKQREELRASLPQELRSNYDLLVSEADNAAIQMPPTTPTPMDPNDKQLLAFYVAQVITHGAHLTHAIDAFLQTVEHNQPPKASRIVTVLVILVPPVALLHARHVFLAHGKFVVLSAHRLVHIGDTVHRNVTRNDVRTRVLQCANALNEALGQTVQKTKQAAQFFPSVTAVQEMVDSVVDVSHLAKDLKVAMIHAAQQP
ncbi:Breast cancer anti-estrogen resistance protein 1 [Cyphomyrmex costatus]|uniref:Breast cancer anti-estrogen resistance protein 1 n=1 Tax=Cyphomyrmex costatus TaxID=456900 RepID=A0A195C3U7_9HYME|nr:Breast cancer anti-estrogen resistance protein 1 [Cyphomyrmex costatus]